MVKAVPRLWLDSSQDRVPIKGDSGTRWMDRWILHHFSITRF